MFYLNVIRARKKTNVRVLMIIRKMKLVFMINLMKMKHRRKMVKLRPNLLLRNKQSLRQCLLAVSPVLYSSKYRKSAG